MPNKKLTDKEIVKALDEAELFLRNRVMDGQSLKLNEYDIGILRNISQVCAKAYDEINRLQAENERLKEQNKILKRDNHFNESGLFNLLHGALVFTKTFDDYKKFRNDFKSEAYKEFAELAVERVEKAKAKYQRLCKEQGEEMEEHMHIHFNGITKIINNLLKELVGEDNATQ